MARRERSAGLSSLLVRAIAAAAALATVMFAIPLAFVVDGLFQAQAFSQLAGDGERVVAEIVDIRHQELAVGTHEEAGGVGPMPDALPATRSTKALVGVYDLRGRRVAGAGPVEAEPFVTSVATQGVEAEATVAGRLVVAIPTAPDDDYGRLVVRVAEPLSALRLRSLAAWSVMAGLAVIVLVLVTFYAVRRARVIAQPLELLAAAADALGRGDFSTRAEHSGVVEVDAVSASLERTARRLGALIERERQFAVDASHQLRTPLTAVRLGLESALITPEAELRQGVADALVAVDRLEETVLDLLSLARDTSGPQPDVQVHDLLRHALAAWRPLFATQARVLVLSCEGPEVRARMSGPALRTVVDVLLDNALIHGEGPVGVSVRSAAGAILLQVSDEGQGVHGEAEAIFARRSPVSTRPDSGSGSRSGAPTSSPASSHSSSHSSSESGAGPGARSASGIAGSHGTGIGLALARSLIEAEGGRLELTRAHPATFTVVMTPAAGREANFAES